MSTSSSSRIQSPAKDLPRNAKVSFLIDENSNRWHEELIKNTFNAEEALAICRIPLSIWQIEDKRVWGPSRNVVHSVKSANHLVHSSLA